MTNEVIFDEVVDRSQGKLLTQLHEHHRQRIRVSVYRDSYPSQSYARAEKWDGVSWHEVWSTPPERMKSATCEDASWMSAKIPPLLREDAAELLRMVYAVMGPA